MSEVVTFTGYRPPPRYDAEPWTEVQIEEADAVDALEADWTLIDTIALTPDADPSDPATRNFTTPNGTAADLWYRLTFFDGNGDSTLPTSPVQNSVGTSPFVTTDEFFRILKIRNPSDDQVLAAERVLETAAGEIAAEVDLASDDALTGWELALAAEVNLERAVEHWRQQESPFGLVGLGGDLGASFTARDSWDRHAHKLAPLKSRWGLA